MENLTWDIIERPIYSNNQKIEGYKGIFRSDSGTLLNVTKESYTPTRNEKFVEVTEKLSNITGFPIENYYTVEGGKKILSFLKCTEPLQVCGYDFKDYLMVGNSHDSSTGFFIGNSNIMVRCQNRFSKNFRSLQAYHTKNNNFKIDTLVGYFDLFMKERKKIFYSMEQFADIRIDDSIKRELLERLTRMNEEEKAGKEISTRKINLVHAIEESIERECEALGNNALGLFQGITHYTTHVKKTKEKVFGNPFGTQNEMNQTAFKFCNDLVLN